MICPRSPNHRPRTRTYMLALCEAFFHYTSDQGKVGVTVGARGVLDVSVTT